MSNNLALIRSLLVYVVCLPLAVFIGYKIAGPLDYTTLVLLGLLLFLMALPLLLKWHHVWLIASWNMSMMFYFLPGKPTAWMMMSFMSFFISLGQYILSRRKYVHDPSVTWSLICLGLVVLATAKLTGGLGLRMMGDETHGGKRYFYIWVAILGYFAFTSQTVSKEKRKFYATLFILGGVTQVIGETAAFINPAFYFIFLFFPPDIGGAVSLLNRPLAGDYIARFGGVANAAASVIYTLMLRYGIAGILTSGKFWRLLLFIGCLVFSALGGFRSMLILIGMIFVFVFWFEGLFRSRLLPVIVLMTVLGGAFTVSFSDRLPLNIQRALSFLPLRLDPVAVNAAKDSSTWRLEMWKNLLPEVPRYLLIGKGYSFSAQEAAMITDAPGASGQDVGAGAALAGDYHNGPLSVIIPFGIFGALAFLWFLWASLRVLQSNYKYGDPDSRTVNTFLLSYFIAKTIMFFVIFGGFYGDLMHFVGIVGVSLALNGGVAKPPAVIQQKPGFVRPHVPLPGRV